MQPAGPLLLQADFERQLAALEGSYQDRLAARKVALERDMQRQLEALRQEQAALEAQVQEQVGGGWHPLLECCSERGGPPVERTRRCRLDEQAWPTSSRPVPAVPRPPPADQGGPGAARRASLLAAGDG
jgi:hypothetical protein